MKKIIKYHGDSVSKALCELFPDIGLLRNNFKIKIKKGKYIIYIYLYLLFAFKFCDSFYFNLKI